MLELRMVLSGFVEKVIKKWPGKRYLGIYRFMPFFFLMGATVEFAMIKWRPLGVNFYDVYQKKEVAKVLEEEQSNFPKQKFSNSA